MAEEAVPDGVKSATELRSDLAGYEEQQQQVGQLLLQDPENDELQEMYSSLSEVISLTRELLADAAAAEAGAAAAAAQGTGADKGGGASSSGASAPGLGGGVAVTAAGAGAAPGAGALAEQIKRAQQRQALGGLAPAGWAVGAECLAYYANDGQWYPAKVQAVAEDGKFVVVYEGYGNTEELVPGSVRPRPQEEAQEVYRGVAAPKRKRVEDEPLVTEIPQWLDITAEDDEKTVARKKKLLKSYKSKIRFQKLDTQTKEKQSSWQSFLKGKGTKPKAGFMTGKKKQSMFSVPEGGKVGVVGSGRGMTEYQKAGRHDFSVEGE